jgi:hypothetical protein
VLRSQTPPLGQDDAPLYPLVCEDIGLGLYTTYHTRRRNLETRSKQHFTSPTRENGCPLRRPPYVLHHPITHHTHRTVSIDH